MKKPEITPGPWTSEDAMKNQDCGWRIHTPQSKPYGMAHIYSPGPHAKANATAIAALPDLLEALEKVFAYTMSHPENREIQGVHIATLCALTKAGYTF